MSLIHVGLAGCITLPVTKDKQERWKKRIMFVDMPFFLVNERLESLFHFVGKFPQACDPENANDSQSAYS